MIKKTNLRRLIAVAALALGVTPALAGYKTTVPVYIDSAARTALGSLGTVRNSADSNQWIGCSVSSGGTGSPWARCYATNAAGQSVSCTAFDAELVVAAGSIRPTSYVKFVWDTYGECTQIRVENWSAYRPM